MIPNRKGLFWKHPHSKIRNKALEELKQHSYAVLRAFSKITIVFGSCFHKPETVSNPASRASYILSLASFRFSAHSFDIPPPASARLCAETVGGRMSNNAVKCKNIAFGNNFYVIAVQYAAKCRNFCDDLSKKLLHLKCFCDMLLIVENI